MIFKLPVPKQISRFLTKPQLLIMTILQLNFNVSALVLVVVQRHISLLLLNSGQIKKHGPNWLATVTD